jgi:hypothetical protein
MTLAVVFVEAQCGDTQLADFNPHESRITSEQ